MISALKAFKTDYREEEYWERMMVLREFIGEEDSDGTWKNQMGRSGQSAFSSELTASLNLVIKENSIEAGGAQWVSGKEMVRDEVAELGRSQVM